VSIPAPRELNLGRIFFWVVLAFAASLASVQLPGGVHAYMNTAVLVATAFDSQLPNPFSVVWVALLGTTSIRELRLQVPWYGVLYNHITFALAGCGASVVIALTSAAVSNDDPLGVVAQIVLAGTTFTLVNTSLAVAAASARTGTPLRRVWALSVPNTGLGVLAQVPLGWLMAVIAIRVGTWATVLFLIPLFLARYTFNRYVELRDLFLGSVSALSQAVDAKDGYTRGHADRVSRIAGAIAREIGLAESEIEHIELAGMLHDIGKIGVEDRILLKPMRLDVDEVEAMQRHPIYGASILEPSRQLRPLVPIVLHHHEHYDGSGYPEGLIGDEIPMGSRILLVADAYEAMTSDRIYRKAIGHERAIQQLNRYKGIQFDPRVVRAFERVLEKHGVAAFEASDLPPITYETLAEVRRRLTREPRSREFHAH
jgi:HD-GYP domain-containing protein (c-di-GMP phosphodiesterase class II)